MGRVYSFSFGVNKTVLERIRALMRMKGAGSYGEIGKWMVDVVWYLAMFRPELLRRIEEEITRMGLWSSRGSRKLGTHGGEGKEVS